MNNLIDRQLAELLSETDDFLANCANFIALIYNNFEHINWCGFYFDNGNELILSVFQGKPACIKIPYNSGVCGHSFSSNNVLVIDNVNSFEGHIACDIASKSEIVFPILYKSQVIGVLDIDSSVFSRFDNQIQHQLSSLLEQFLSKTDLSKIHKYYND